jgi:hypothetical protein
MQGHTGQNPLLLTGACTDKVLRRGPIVRQPGHGCMTVLLMALRIQVNSAICWVARFVNTAMSQNSSITALIA